MLENISSYGIFMSCRYGVFSMESYDVLLAQSIKLGPFSPDDPCILSVHCLRGLFYISLSLLSLCAASNESVP